VLIALIAIFSGAFLGKNGLTRSFEQTVNIAQGVSRDARINMYRIALELIAQKPVQGHGIGNFLRVWNLQTSDYISRHPDANLPSYVNHPHNELVYWLIEGGLMIVAGILAAIVAVVSGLIRCGPQRAAGYIAMLTPITLHTQVELPFYISSVHWFLWLFLIFVVMRHREFKQNMRISLATIRLIQTGSLIIFTGSLYFLQHTSRAQADIMDFVTQRAIDSPYLEVALKNSYHKQLAEELAMRALLNKGISTDNTEYIRQYIQWSAKPMAMQPKLIFFGDLVNAYTYLKDDESRCRIIESGLKMYAHNKKLRTLKQSCTN
jgi:O-antigen polymerase